MSGQKIINGLKDAASGNFASVHIDGYTWVRLDKIRQRLSECHGYTEDQRMAALEMVGAFPFDLQSREH